MERPDPQRSEFCRLAGKLADSGEAPAIHDWTFLLGPSVVLGVNSLLLAYLAYRSELAPRPIAVLGLVGGPLVTASAIAVLFGLYGPAVHAISALPVFAWEVSFAVYLIAKGFKAFPVADRTVAAGGVHPELSVA
ncbi:DUF4386 domain-containing protein [Rhodococcus sp. NPDC059234]|uniref:DUF4386 domain-containing protein n=1 Tax=Rhodococcus sp. NPDC059234 TaxID=3346781 RepID=UPI00366DF8B1